MKILKLIGLIEQRKKAGGKKESGARSQYNDLSLRLLGRLICHLLAQRLHGGGEHVRPNHVHQLQAKNADLDRRVDALVFIEQGECLEHFLLILVGDVLHQGRQ